MDELPRDYQSFLISVPSKATQDDLTLRAQAAPIQINTSPILFLSAPVDREHDTADLDPAYQLTVVPTSHGFVFNPNTHRTEFLVFVDIPDMSILSHLDVDIINFRPYFCLAIDPMRTRMIRFWCKNFGDSLVGNELAFTVPQFMANPVLSENYNPTCEQDHPHAFSQGL